MRGEISESESYSSASLEKRRLADAEMTYVMKRKKIAEMRGVSVLIPDFQNHIFTPAFE